MKKDHIYFMKKAFEEAKYAFYKNEVPVGCVIVNENEIISRSSNMVELLNDSTAHAELIAITSAQNYLNSKNLEGCTLYATLEPCLMCHGFSTYNLEIDRKIKIIKGVMEEESRELLDKFFKKIRG